MKCSTLDMIEHEELEVTGKFVTSVLIAWRDCIYFVLLKALLFMRLCHDHTLACEIRKSQSMGALCLPQGVCGKSLTKSLHSPVSNYTVGRKSLVGSYHLPP